eukprot:Sspe_Gene.35542::Locus_17220_Transcript_1_1_Confidence_1.000_Length_1795::g.35542::m.35542
MPGDVGGDGGLKRTRSNSSDSDDVDAEDLFGSFCPRQARSATPESSPPRKRDRKEEDKEDRNDDRKDSASSPRRGASNSHQALPGPSRGALARAIRQWERHRAETPSVASALSLPAPPPMQFAKEASPLFGTITRFTPLSDPSPASWRPVIITESRMEKGGFRDAVISFVSSSSFVVNPRPRLRVDALVRVLLDRSRQVPETIGDVMGALTDVLLAVQKASAALLCCRRVMIWYVIDALVKVWKDEGLRRAGEFLPELVQTAVDHASCVSELLFYRRMVEGWHSCIPTKEWLGLLPLLRNRAPHPRAVELLESDPGASDPLGVTTLRLLYEPSVKEMFSEPWAPETAEHRVPIIRSYTVPSATRAATKESPPPPGSSRRRKPTPPQSPPPVLPPRLAYVEPPARQASRTQQPGTSYSLPLPLPPPCTDSSAPPPSDQTPETVMDADGSLIAFF